MFFEDAQERTLAAIQLLESQKNGLTIQTLEEFLDCARHTKLTRHEKSVIVDQAILLIDQFYAHLPFKRARYAVDPVQRLRLIHARIGELSDLEFHSRVLRVFLRLRDAHTFYGLPAPYRGAFAFLPFEMDRFHSKSGRRRFVVTKVLEGFNHPSFNVGAEILLWNGMPVERAIELAGHWDPGGNPASKFVRGLNRMCNRLLGYTVPPDERYVTIQYTPADGGNEQHAIVLAWHVASSAMLESNADLARIGQILWKREPHTSFEVRTDLRDDAHPDLRFGYIRIRSFELDPADRFVAEFGRILGVMQKEAPDGLILDVRSNPGGSIEAAERILQYMTPMQIEPARFHFLNSQLTQHVAANVKHAEPGNHQLEWLPWVEDLVGSVSSGSVLTEGKPLTNPDDANDTGQRYQGPITLIIDALAYSATDIFAGGFQDHRIGKIIGVDENTGGGGANRWLHEELVSKLEHVPGVALQKLPGGAQMGLAIRRSSRVGARAGHPVEDFGVACDVKYLLTRDDALHGDRDLLQFACAQLAVEPVNQLKIVKAELQTEGIELTVSSRNLFRIECLVNGLLQCAVAADRSRPFLVPTAGLPDAPALIRVNGFALVKDSAGVQELQLVATDAFAFP